MLVVVIRSGGYQGAAVESHTYLAGFHSIAQEPERKIWSCKLEVILVKLKILGSARFKCFGQ